MRALWSTIYQVTNYICNTEVIRVLHEEYELVVLLTDLKTLAIHPFGHYNILIDIQRQSGT
jgi:hypothetical protein